MWAILSTGLLSWLMGRQKSKEESQLQVRSRNINEVVELASFKFNRNVYICCLIFDALLIQYLSLIYIHRNLISFVNNDATALMFMHKYLSFVYVPIIYIWLFCLSDWPIKLKKLFVFLQSKDQFKFKMMNKNKSTINNPIAFTRVLLLMFWKSNLQ